MHKQNCCQKKCINCTRLLIYFSFRKSQKLFLLLHKFNYVEFLYYKFSKDFNFLGHINSLLSDLQNFPKIV